jgi:penicillin-binding protein 1C
MDKKKIVLFILLLGALLLAGWSYFTFRDLPDASALPGHLNRPSIRITDRKGNLLYEILPDQGNRHAVLPAADIPQCMKDATIAVEDGNFYHNPGVDLAGILRAFWINLQGGETLAGGSTITQQVARNLLLQDERYDRSLRRKLRESLLAWRLARELPKDDILALYLNQTDYGGMSIGVEAASQTYFGKPASALTLPECALLAGLPQAPGLYNPLANPDRARERQKVVLGLMEKQGYLNADQRAEAEAIQLEYNPAPYPMLAPHFVWLVRARVQELIQSGAIDPKDSLVVRTTLDLDMQQHAEAIITRRIQEFKDTRGGLDRNVNNAALVALDPRSGEVLALVGSADYFDATINGAVDMATAPRQSGSVFKPFIYAEALDPRHEQPWTGATMLMDVSTTFQTHDGQPYTPINYDGREHGPVWVRDALASSLNVPAVLTLQKVGIDDTLSLAQEVGITTLGSPNDYDLTLALGGGQMRLLELTTAFGTFANQGGYTGYYTILDIHNFKGDLLYTEQKQPVRRVFDPRVAWLVSDILSDDRARVIGFGHNSALKIDRTAAVKTGTTTNFHDNWTIGYTPDLVTGVWVGNSDYQAMRNVNGLTGAAPIWHEFMRTILAGTPDRPFQRPEGLTQVEVCALSGLLPTQSCPYTRSEWFIDGTQPTRADTLYQPVVLDSATGLLAGPSTPPGRRTPAVALDLPANAQPWARAQGLLLLADLTAASAPTGEPAPRIVLLSPQTNTTYLLAADFTPDAQRLQVEAAADADFIHIAIVVDGVTLAILNSPPYQAWWPLAKGVHRFWAEGAMEDGTVVRSEVVEIVVEKE